MRLSDVIMNFCEYNGKYVCIIAKMYFILLIIPLVLLLLRILLEMLMLVWFKLFWEPLMDIIYRVKEFIRNVNRR